MTQTFHCPRCGTILPYGTLVCPSCGALIYASRLNELAAAATAAEARDPRSAIPLWQEALMLLPPDSQQAHLVQERLISLTRGTGQLPVIEYQPPPPPSDDTLGVALLKTGGSMLLSIAIYSSQWGWQFATGFVLLILVHELGHSLAMRHYGLKASPPIFIPFLGALINLRTPPRNALEESVVGIAGPVAGTVGAVGCYIWYLKTGNLLALDLAFFGFFLNLFNLLPVPPLDGGRVTAAISPVIWMPGLLIVVGWIVYNFISKGRVSFMLVLLLFFAWPRIKQTLSGEARRGEYYQISRAARWGMGVAYVTLGLSLLILFLHAMMQRPPGMVGI